MMKVKEILARESFSREEIVRLLSSENEDKRALFLKSAEVKEEYVGNKVWFRGLITAE